MLSVTVASTDQDFTTTSALRRETLGATATATGQDVQLSALIRRSSRWAETFIGYPIGVQTYRESVAGYGKRNLMLSRAPVRAVLAVYDATDTGTAQSLLSSNIRVEDAEAGLLSRDMGFGWNAMLQFRATPYGQYGSGDAMPLIPAPMPGQEYKPWLVDYVAGWTLAGVDTGSPNYSTGNVGFGSTSTGRTLPDDIEYGVLLKAQGYYAGGEDIQSEKLGDIETNFRSLGTDEHGRLVTPAQVWLEPYRRVA